MIVMCWDNWSVFLQLVDSEAYKTLKKQKGKRYAAAFQSFEDCLSPSFKRELRDAKAVLSYASATLHELEGDKQLSSIVVPAYCIFFYCISQINEEPDMTLSAQTRTQIIDEVWGSVCRSERISHVVSTGQDALDRRWFKNRAPTRCALSRLRIRRIPTLPDLPCSWSRYVYCN